VIFSWLNNGSTLELRPTAVDGLRWIGLATPVHAIERAVSYAGGRELRYAVPFDHGEFVGWLRPGQSGPRRATYRLGSGTVAGATWSAHAYAGPWGLCIEGPGAGDCSASPADWVLASGRTSEAMCSPAKSGSFDVGKVANTVRLVRIRLSNASAITAVPVQIEGGARLYSVDLPARPGVLG
jgi:hypothetical protein